MTDGTAPAVTGQCPRCGWPAGPDDNFCEACRADLRLTPPGQQIMQNIYHKQRANLAPAILAEIDKRSTELDAASPAGHLRFIRVPVLLLHGSDDTIIPPTELLWLERDIPQEYLVTAIVSPAIGHVEVGSKVSLGDKLALVHWIALVIREARNTTAGKGPQSLPAGEWLAPVVNAVAARTAAK